MPRYRTAIRPSLVHRIGVGTFSSNMQKNNPMLVRLSNPVGAVGIRPDKD
jgi:hypothetical protein